MGKFINRKTFTAETQRAQRKKLGELCVSAVQKSLFKNSDVIR